MHSHYYCFTRKEVRLKARIDTFPDINQFNIEDHDLVVTEVDWNHARRGDNFNPPYVEWYKECMGGTARTIICGSYAGNIAIHDSCEFDLTFKPVNVTAQEMQDEWMKDGEAFEPGLCFVTDRTMINQEPHYTLFYFNQHFGEIVCEADIAVFNFLDNLLREIMDRNNVKTVQVEIDPQ